VYGELATVSTFAATVQVAVPFVSALEGLEVRTDASVGLSVIDPVPGGPSKRNAIQASVCCTAMT
jgi:hypothetical protein